MQVSFNKVEDNDIKYKAEVTVDADQALKCYKKAIAEVKAKASLDGFRKGHVPERMLLQHFGYRIMGQTADDIIVDSISEVAEYWKDLDIVDKPSVSLNQEYVEGKPFTYIVECEVFPSCDFGGDAKAINVELVKCDIAESDVDNMIEQLRQQQAKWQAVDDLAVADDTMADIAFEGFRDGVAFEGGKAEHFSLEVGKTPMIPGFTESIVGHKAGEEFEFEVTFPEDYKVEELKSAKATFKVKVHSVSQRVLPEVNDDFLKLFGVKDGIEAFRNSLRQQLTIQAKNLVLQHNQKAVAEAIADKAGELPIPQTYLDSEVERHLNRMEERYKAYKLDIALLPEELRNNMKKDAEEQGKKSARLSLAVHAFTKQFNVEELEVSVEALRNKIQSYAASYEDPEGFTKFVLSDKEMKDMMAKEVANEQVFNAIVATISTTEKQVGFTELTELVNKQN